MSIEQLAFAPSQLHARSLPVTLSLAHDRVHDCWAGATFECRPVATGMGWSARVPHRFRRRVGALLRIALGVDGGWVTRRCNRSANRAPCTAKVALSTVR